MVSRGVGTAAGVWVLLITLASASLWWSRQGAFGAQDLMMLLGRWGLLLIGPIHLTWWWLDRSPGQAPWQRLAAFAVPGLCGVALVSSALGLSPSALHAFMGAGVLTFATALVHQARRADRVDRALAREQRRRDLAQQRLLGAQLGPYLLPRLLQRLHALALADAAAVAPHVLDLAQMMRFLTTSAPRDLHPVGQEWAFLLAYRRTLGATGPSEAAAPLHFEGDEADPFPALVLATWFEYAVRLCGGGPQALGIEVHLSTREDGFDFRLCCPTPQHPPHGELRAGLKALRQQLRHLYGGRSKVRAQQHGAVWALTVRAC